MKKIILTLGISLTISTNLFSGAAVVIDPTHIAKTTAGWVAEAKRWETELINTTGIRDSVQFMRDVQQLQKVMDEWRLDLMDLNIDNPQSQIGVMAKQLFDKYTLFDDCNPSYYNDDQKRICKNRMIRNVQEMAAYQSFSDDLYQRSKRIEVLNERLTNSIDMKESQDISNGIAIEMAKVQATKIQIDLMRSNNEAIEKAEKRQKQQIYNSNRLKHIDWSGAPLPTSL